MNRGWVAAAVLAAAGAAGAAGACATSVASEHGGSASGNGATSGASPTGGGGGMGGDGTLDGLEPTACDDLLDLGDRAECAAVAIVADPSERVTDCRVPLDIDWGTVNLNHVNVAVECELVPYSETSPSDDETTSWWRFDDPARPGSILIEGELCEHIDEVGVERIDAVFQCANCCLE